MKRSEEAKLLEQIEQWNDADEFSRCIAAIENIPEQDRSYALTIWLARAYSNLAVLGDHGAHGEDAEVNGELLQHAIELLESIRTQVRVTPIGMLEWVMRISWQTVQLPLPMSMQNIG